jgi:hypothetical protein
MIDQHATRRPSRYLMTLIAVLIALTALMTHATNGSAACNPYYETCPPVTPPTNPPPTVKPSVRIHLSTKCRRNPFTFTPKIRGTVSWSRLTIGNRRIKTLRSGPFRFRIPVTRYKRGKRTTFTLTTRFTSGEKIVRRGSFRRCR